MKRIVFCFSLGLALAAAVFVVKPASATILTTIPLRTHCSSVPAFTPDTNGVFRNTSLFNSMTVTCRLPITLSSAKAVRHVEAQILDFNGTRTTLQPCTRTSSGLSCRAPRSGVSRNQLQTISTLSGPWSSATTGNTFEIVVVLPKRVGSASKELRGLRLVY